MIHSLITKSDGPDHSPYWVVEELTNINEPNWQAQLQLLNNQ